MGRKYLAFEPSKKSVGRITAKIGERLDPRRVEPWEPIGEQLNQKLRRLEQYFRSGTVSAAYRAVNAARGRPSVPAPIPDSTLESPSSAVSSRFYPATPEARLSRDRKGAVC